MQQFHKVLKKLITKLETNYSMKKKKKKVNMRNSGFS